MARVAYDRSAAARDGTSPPQEQRVVSYTFNTYFGILDFGRGRDYRISSVMGRRF